MESTTNDNYKKLSDFFNNIATKASTPNEFRVGGYGVGYINEVEKPKQLNIENWEKLPKIKRQSMILFNMPQIDEEYKWKVEDVFGEKGVLVIKRKILGELDASNFLKNTSVKLMWKGTHSGSDWVDVKSVKDPNFILDYIESCLDGKYENKQL